MAATKLSFVTQPNGTKQGYTLTGYSSSSVNLGANQGIQVAVLDNNNVVQTTDTSSVTLAFGTNPTALTPPVQTAPSTSTTGGTGLAASTQYFYVVTGISPTLGESTKSNEQNITTGLGGTNSNTVNWTPNSAYTSYRVYRGTTTGGENVYYTVGNVSTFVDTGAASTSGSPPVTSTPAAVLQGTLTQPVINGYATFPDLAVSVGGTGFTLTATDGALTSATSNAFTITSINRIDPAVITGTITSTGLGNSSSTIGPFRFRAGSGLKGIEISGYSTNSTDAFQVYLTEPGQATATTLTTNIAQKPYILSGGSEHAVGPLPVPCHVMMDSDQLGVACDVYLVGTTVTGTITATIKRAEFGGRPS